MIELVTKDWEDEDYCSEHNCEAVGTLKLNGVKVPLCMHCIEMLQEEVNEFLKPQYCFQCKYFIMSSSGWHYGGSCNIDGTIPAREAGYCNCRDCMDSCSKFEEEKGEK